MHRFFKNNFLKDINILDLFAGTGAFSFEAISRGASFATLIEKDFNVSENIKKNISNLKISKQTRVINNDSFELRENIGIHELYFIDAPYLSGYTSEILIKASEKGWLSHNPLIICEISSEEELILPKNFKQVLTRIYGNTKIEFLGSNP